MTASATILSHIQAARGEVLDTVIAMARERVRLYSATDIDCTMLANFADALTEAKAVLMVANDGGGDG